MTKDRHPLAPLLEQYLALLEGEIELSKMRQRRRKEMAEALRQRAEAFGRAAASLKPHSPDPEEGTS